MKKSINILSFAFAMIISCMILFGNTVYAEISEGGLYNNPKKQDIVIMIGYENDDFKLYFKDPSGNRVALNDSNVSFEKLDNVMFVYVKDAAAGQWNVVYDKGTNESLKMSVAPANQSLKIKSFDIGKPTGNKMQVQFAVDRPEGQSYQYEIYISTDSEFSSQRMLASSWSNSEEKETVELDLSSVNSSSEYYLKLFVYYEDNENVYFDDLVSKSFEYNNSENVEAYKGYEINVNLTDRNVTFTADKDLPWEVRHIYVHIEADGNELVDELLDRDSGEKTVIAQYDPGVKEIVCKSSVQYNTGRVSPEEVKKINLDEASGAFAMSVPGNGVSNNKTYVIDYKNADNQTIFVKVNDEAEQEIVLDKEGKKGITLKDTESNIVIRYTDKDEINYTLQSYIVIDDIPPLLGLYENLDGMSTDKSSIIVTGKTDEGSKLTANGEDVELGKNGSFSYEFNLEEGENTLNISSSDEAGNIATFAIKINRKTAAEEVGELVDNETANKVLKYLPMMLAFFASLFGILEMIVLASGKKKKKPVASTLMGMSIVLLVFSAICLVGDGILYFIRRRYEKSSKYIDLALDFPKRAHEYISLTKKIGILIWVFAALVVVSVLCIIVCILIKKFCDPAKKEAKAQAKAQKEAAKKAEAARKAEEAKKAEEARKAEEAKKAEETAKEEATSEDKTAAKEEAKTEAKTQETKSETVESEKEPKKEPEKAPAKAPAKDKAKPAGKKFCTQCGTKLALDDRFCTKCGKPQK